MSQEARNFPTIACQGVIGMVSKKLDRAEPAFFRPHPHPDGRHEEKIEPRMPGEESEEIGLPAFEKARDHEGKKSGEQQKDDDENVGDRRGEVADYFSFGDGENVADRIGLPVGFGARLRDCPGRGGLFENGFAHWLSSRFVSGSVMLRKTSSRRPSSVCNSSIFQRSASGELADGARQVSVAFFFA